jgi:putative ABC transport system permease protein
MGEAMRFLPLAIKNIRNNRLRTGLTAGGVAVAMFVLTLFLSMETTMARVVAGAGENNNLIVLQGNAWCSTESRIPENYAEMIRDMPNVLDAMPVYISTTSC